MLDCIDDTDTKVLLLKECHKRGMKVVSCFGAGAKSDPTRIQIGDIGDAIKDPLASKVGLLIRCTRYILFTKLVHAFWSLRLVLSIIDTRSAGL